MTNINELICRAIQELSDKIDRGEVNPGDLIKAIGLNVKEQEEVTTQRDYDIRVRND